ncbi:MAG: methionine--tRNA ligase, partial [Cyclobacteriaceae bacterium]|nr:methionine--tRNA ligase [Cyclobacteriaceae bacterium]
MTKKKRTLVTAALPYANGPIHIGHLAGVYVPADIYVRYLKSKGEDVLFVCGSDEHGVPITLRAKKEGSTPKEVVDKFHNMISQSFDEFGMGFDIYSRTSSKIHHETASQYFSTLLEKDSFEKISSEQYYDPVVGQFLADRYIIGTCPKCNFEEAYGDQCEKCGSTLSSDELINPRSALSGEKPVKKETAHWYIPLDQYESWLNEWIIKDHKKDWKTNVYGQCKSWLDQGLQPRAVTRDLDWGVQVPHEEGKGKVLYVWFDAPIGYISATKEWAEKTGKSWEEYWKSDDTRLIHFIGKDNIVFHCIIFPVMQKAHGDYVLPENVPANEFLNLEGRKISTSRNWAVWLHEYLEEFPEKQDTLRYTLCANAPETKDNDFTWSDFQARNNNELAAIFGNFVKRAVDFTHKNFEGVVPEAGTLFDPEEDLINKIKQAPAQIGHSIENFRFREALNYMMEVARAGNKYLADTEPWKVIKEDRERAGTILNLSLQTVANLALLCKPFLPFTAKKIAKSLNIEQLTWQDAGRIDILTAGQQVGDCGVLFSKIEDDQIKKQVDRLHSTIEIKETAVDSYEGRKEMIEFDDFLKLDIRTGKILEAKKVPKSNKLLELKIDLGFEVRTILSGIAKHYTPEEVVGKNVSVVVNLAPRKMMNIESQGM